MGYSSSAAQAVIYPSFDAELTPEMEDKIAQIVDFAEDGDGTIEDSAIDGFFGKALDKETKRLVRSVVSEMGVEIVVGSKVKTVFVNGDDEVDRVAFGEVMFDSDVAYDRDGDIDGFKQFLRSVRNYPLLTQTQEVVYCQNWQRGRAALNVLATLKDKGLNIAGKETVEISVSRKASEEEVKEYYMPLVGLFTKDLQEIANKGKDCRDMMINSNIRLSIAFAKKLTTNRDDFEDLYQAGIEGLMKACDKFDYHKGYRFSTYATWWVRQTQARHRSDHGRCIRIPAHIYELQSRIKRSYGEYLAEFGKDPSDKELAEYVGMTEEKLIQLRTSTSEILSTDFLINPDGDDSDATTMENYIAISDDDCPENIAMNNELNERLRECVMSIPERYREVLCYRLGILGYDKKSLDEVSEIIGVTKERVRQIETQAYKELKKPIYVKKLKGFSDFFA